MGEALRTEAITSYVGEVRPDLWGPFWARRRIEAELADHLGEAVERLQEKGLPRSEAERRAVEAFGSPGEVAHAFARSKGIGVPTQFTRWSGLALMVGFPIFLAAMIYADISWAFSIGWFAEIASAAGALVVAGLVGMYLRLRGQLGKLGRIGFRMMLLGFIVGMVSGSLWFVAGGAVGLGIMLTGVATYVYAMFRTSVFPRSAYALIALGAAAAAVIGFTGFFTELDTEYLAGPAGYLLCGAGLLRIALHMWRETPQQQHQPPPPAVAV
ncbi:MAG: permease prefix domain 1-containing protein [Actinomycetota bacterium]